MSTIYDATTFKSKAGLDLPACSIFYEGAITDKPSQTITAAGMDKIKAAPGPVCIDVETWTDPLKYQAMMQQVSKLGRDDVGLYQQPPVRNYWAPALHTLTNPPQHDARIWKRQNNDRKGLAAYCDVIFPSLYTFYTDVAGWEKYAIANICEARRVAPGKKVLPFLWPRYHDSNATLKYTLLPKEYVYKQLLVCAMYADGAVIWDHQPTLDFDPAWPWWQAYQEFKAAGGLEL